MTEQFFFKICIYIQNKNPWVGELFWLYFLTKPKYKWQQNDSAGFTKSWTFQFFIRTVATPGDPSLSHTHTLTCSLSLSFSLSHKHTHTYIHILSFKHYGFFSSYLPHPLPQTIFIFLNTFFLHPCFIFVNSSFFLWISFSSFPILVLLFLCSSWATASCCNIQCVSGFWTLFTWWLWFGFRQPN